MTDNLNITSNDSSIKMQSTNPPNEGYDSSIITTKKLTASKWNMIEKPLSEDDRKRNQIIMNLGETTSTSNLVEEINKSSLITIGEYNYLQLRDKIYKNSVKLPALEKNNAAEKALKLLEKNKKFKIILDNCKKTLTNKFNILISALEDDPEEKLFSDLMLKNDYIEFRIIILMKILESLTKKYVDIEKVEEIILGSKKILFNLKKIQTNQNNKINYFNKIYSVDGVEIKLCDQLIIDFEYKISKIIEIHGIKLYDIANRRPKLIFDTKYDETIPEIKLKPYDSQIELSNIVKNNIQNGFMIFYKTLPGLGKTSMILSICNYIRKSKLDLKVIFCCSDILESVRVQVLRTMFNFGIKFGTANANLKKNEYKITNSWNCPNDDDRELIVGDYLSIYLILKEAKHKYLLFFDEPTVLTDQLKNTNTLNYLCKILYYTPKHIILSSATLPLVDELSLIVENYKNKYPGGVVKEVLSNKTLIGCIIKDFNNNIITPHSQCNTQKELEELLIKIKKFPLLGKFYTLPFLMNLNNFMKMYNKNIDIETIESFDQESVLENILLLLERVTTLDTDAFTKFKTIQISDINENVYDTTRLDINYDKVIPSKFLTGHAFKYFGCCLVASDDPYEYVKNNLFEVLEKIKEKVNIRSVHKDYEKYKKEVKKFNVLEEAIKQKYSSEEVINEKLEILYKTQPKYNFNKSLEINSHDHIKSFAKYVKSYDNTMLKNSIQHEALDITEYTIDDNLKMLLYMGVGVYSKSLDSDYTAKVLEMLADRELAYIFADESFCYGANYQISNVIISDDIGNTHSINTILQLIGRTSRIGKSWSGRVYLDTLTADRICKFFKDPSFNSNEGNNITETFKKVCVDIKNEVEIEKEKSDKLLKEKEEKLKNEKTIKKISTELTPAESKENTAREENENSWRNFVRIPVERRNNEDDVVNKNLDIVNKNLEKEEDLWLNIRNKPVIVENDSCFKWKKNSERNNNTNDVKIDKTCTFFSKSPPDENVHLNNTLNKNSIDDEWLNIRKAKNPVQLGSVSEIQAVKSEKDQPILFVPKYRSKK